MGMIFIYIKLKRQYEQHRQKIHLVQNHEKWHLYTRRGCSSSRPLSFNSALSCWHSKLQQRCRKITEAECSVSEPIVFYYRRHNALVKHRKIIKPLKDRFIKSFLQIQHFTGFLQHKASLKGGNCRVVSTSACLYCSTDTCLFNACLVCVWIMSTLRQRLVKACLYFCLYNEPSAHWLTTASPFMTADRHEAHGTREN